MALQRSRPLWLLTIAACSASSIWFPASARYGLLFNGSTSPSGPLAFINFLICGSFLLNSGQGYWAKLKAIHTIYIYFIFIKKVNYMFHIQNNYLHAVMWWTCLWSIILAHASWNWLKLKSCYIDKTSQCRRAKNWKFTNSILRLALKVNQSS